VAELGRCIEGHRRFAAQGECRLPAGAGTPGSALRVYERDAGETLACGTGACAAVVAGIRLGWLDPTVEVQARGGRCHHMEWPWENVCR
jgi:diaminopimelate epimerase